METGLLEDIGLTRSEALVYITLSEIGSSTTGKIVKKSGVASSKIYEILDKLEKKGLVSHVIKTGVKEFEAAPPEMILMYLEEKERKLKKQKIRTEKFVKFLQSKIPATKNKQEATIYRGKEGRKTVFYNCLSESKSGSTIYVMNVPARSPATDNFFIRWNKERAKRKIKLKIIFNESARRNMQTFPENNPLSDIRFMPKEFVTPSAINIYNDNIIIFPYESGEEDPIFILIRSKKVSESFLAQFNFLWNFLGSEK